ncbi:molecular chaperone Hsp33 [Pseudochelatococcus lubricantis]|uniref:Molecular chaperone Hsp33 n=1 Tax=Pseudochelatococcus lubricantis TaxID=1538102 RepID=A0ABX0V2T5_9HYPH|nr:Hsp33 family molecular chaperone [Pseudochelatococcus lubricantis]NIJ58135.1 molecular chaperone Hsp33 [Pseudochelatococcus lubricantis]
MSAASKQTGAQGGVPAGAREGADDSVLPFAAEGLDVRGRTVRLGPSIDLILSRHGYPPVVSRVLGEAAALTVLLGSALKFQGRFQLQTRSDGPVSMVVVDFDTPDRLRACATFDADKVAAAEAAGETGTGALLGHGHLALTIDQGAEMSRYQGIVAIEGGGFEDAAHTYFRQSEQIPTRVRLAVGEEISGAGEGRHTAYRAGGLMVQFLPQGGEGAAAQSAGEDGDEVDDRWREAHLLVDTVEDHELIDSTVSSERLLYRLFHERGVRVFEAQGVREACRCDRSRILATLTRFDEDDRRAMVGDDGRIGVTCEFCSRHYDIDPAEIGLESGSQEGSTP